MDTLSVWNLLWWPLYSISVMGILDPYLKADKERLPAHWRLLGLIIAIGAPIFGLTMLFLGWKLFGFLHVLLAVVAIPIGSIVFGIGRMLLGLLAVSIMRQEGEARASTLGYFRETPPILSLILLPLVIYQLVSMYT